MFRRAMLSFRKLSFGNIKKNFRPFSSQIYTHEKPYFKFRTEMRQIFQEEKANKDFDKLFIEACILYGISVPIAINCFFYLYDHHIDPLILKSIALSDNEETASISAPFSPFRQVELLEDHCYGFTSLWYIYNQQNKNFINEANQIKEALKKRQSLDDKQQKLMDDLRTVQTSRQNRKPIFVKKNSIDSDLTKKLMVTDYSFRIKGKKEIVAQAADLAIEKAIAHPGDLIQLRFPCQPNQLSNILKETHVIGTVAEYDNNQLQIKIFDANKGETTYHNPNDAKAKLTSRIQDGYYQSRIDFVESKLGLFGKNMLQKIDSFLIEVNVASLNPEKDILINESKDENQPWIHTGLR